MGSKSDGTRITKKSFNKKVNRLFEYKLIQNPALLMSMQCVTISNYCSSVKGASGLKFPLLFILTPILFNKEIVESVYNKRHPGVLFKAIDQNRAAWIGLQERMEATFDITMQALSLGLRTRKIELDAAKGTLSTETKKGAKYENVNLKRMLATAKRFGIIFSELSPEQITRALNIVF